LAISGIESLTVFRALTLTLFGPCSAHMIVGIYNSKFVGLVIKHGNEWLLGQLGTVVACLTEGDGLPEKFATSDWQ